MSGKPGTWIESGLFSRYAEEDLDRWRVLIGGSVEHVDRRWGIGRVEAVRWATSGHGVAPYVRVRVRYPDHGAVIYRAASFHVHHRSVTIPETVRGVIRACYESPCTEERREELLRRHTRGLREAEDRRRLEHADRLRRRAIERKEAGD